MNLFNNQRQTCMKKYASTTNVASHGYRTHKNNPYTNNSQASSGNPPTCMLKESKLMNNGENTNIQKNKSKEYQCESELSKQNFNQNTNHKIDRMSKKKSHPNIIEEYSKIQMNQKANGQYKNTTSVSNTFNSPRNLYSSSGAMAKTLKDRIMGRNQHEPKAQAIGQKNNFTKNHHNLPLSPSDSTLAYKNYFLKNSSSVASLYTNKYSAINSSKSISKTPKALGINDYLITAIINSGNRANSPKFQVQSKKKDEISQNLPYSNLKNKIDSIAGKLQEIKKDYEVAQKEKKEGQVTTQKGFSKQKSNPNHDKQNIRSLYNHIQNCNQGIETEQKQNLLIKGSKKSSSKQQRSFKSQKNRRQQSQIKQRMKSKSSIFKIQNTTQQLPEKIEQKKPPCQIKTPKTQMKDQQQQNLEKYITKYDPQPYAIKSTKLYTLNQKPEQLNFKNQKKLTQCTSEKNLFRQKNQKCYKDSQCYRQVDQYRYNNSTYYISSILKAFGTKSPSTFDTLCRNHIQSSIQILNYMKDTNLITKALSKKVQQQKIQKLPSPKFKTTIIFDLDETLIHCNDSSVKTPCDVILPIKFPESNHIIKAGINIRPYAQQCLKELSKHFQIMVFTASHQFYANVIIDYLDPKQQYVSYRFYRDSCHKTDEGFYVKDLRVIDRPLKNVLLVDNAAYSYGFQPENGIPIIPFYDNKSDFELKTLLNYLKQEFLTDKQNDAQDVRIKNNQIMKINRYAKYQKPQKLVNQLYI